MNQFVRTDHTGESQGNDLKNNDTWLKAAANQKSWKQIEQFSTYSHGNSSQEHTEPTTAPLFQSAPTTTIPCMSLCELDLQASTSMLPNCPKATTRGRRTINREAAGETQSPMIMKINMKYEVYTKKKEVKKIREC